MDKRKTQENVNQTAIARPSSRISRLAQPRKYSATPHTLNKNRSTSTENISSNNRQINKRARSATPHIVGETPARPPIARSLSVLFTPASHSKSVILKKPANEQVARILEVLRKHFGPTFLSGGLQSMSAKQFVEIIRFFAQNICGDKVVIQDNNVDDVKRFVDFIGYPQQTNKSGFKTPCVSVAYDRNVELLDWFCDFVSFPDGSSIVDDVENTVGESSNFVDQELCAGFVGDVKNGYVIWSNRIGEFDEWKSKWIYRMIAAKTEMDDIEDAIDRLGNECKKLQAKDSCTFGKEHLLQGQQKKADELNDKVTEMTAEVEAKKIDFQETSNELNELAVKYEALMGTVNEMKETIKNQKVSSDDRQNIIAEMKQKEHSVTEKREYVKKIKSSADENQVTIARLTKQKTSKVFSFNTFVQKLFQVGIDFGDLTINQLSLQENDNEDSIKTKLQLFAQIKKLVNQRRTDIHSAMSETHTELTTISNDLFKIEDDVSSLKKQIHSMEIQIQKIENEMTDTKYNSEQQQHQLQIQIDKSQQKYEQIISKIKNSEKLAESLKEENEKIFQGIEVKTNSLLDAKRRRQARREAALDELIELKDRLKDAVKSLK